MDKWRAQLDLAHQMGPEIPLHGILMVVVSYFTGGEEVWAEFFALKNWTYFRLWLTNQLVYGKMDDTGGFSASNWSKTNSLCCSDCRLVMLYKGVK